MSSQLTKSIIFQRGRWLNHSTTNQSWWCQSFNQVLKEFFLSLQKSFLADGYPLVNIHIAIEHGPVEIVSFPMNSMVILTIVTLQ